MAPADLLEDLQRLGGAQFGRSRTDRCFAPTMAARTSCSRLSCLPTPGWAARSLQPRRIRGRISVAHRVGLEVGREPRGDLAGVGEGQHLAAAQRREVAVGLRARRLDLKLAGDQRLERLVALGLVVLHRRAAEAGDLRRTRRRA